MFLSKILLFIIYKMSLSSHSRTPNASSIEDSPSYKLDSNIPKYLTEITNRDSRILQILERIIIQISKALEELLEYQDKNGSFIGYTKHKEMKKVTKYIDHYSKFYNNIFGSGKLYESFEDFRNKRFKGENYYNDAKIYEIRNKFIVYKNVKYNRVGNTTHKRFFKLFDELSKTYPHGLITISKAINFVANFENEEESSIYSNPLMYYSDEIEKKYLPIAKSNIKKQQMGMIKSMALVAKTHPKSRELKQIFSKWAKHNPDLL